MKTIVVRCPECNATLDATAEAREVKCSYCGTTSVIQHRTRILQRPAPLPPPPADRPQPRVATQQVSWTRWLAVLPGLLAFIGLFGGPILIIWCVRSQTAPYGPALLVDVNHDGAEDVVALFRSRERETMRLVALESQSGKRLWRSEELRGGSEFGMLCTAGDVVIDGDKGPNLVALDLASGKIRWRARLEEAVHALCAGPDGTTVHVVTADKQTRPISLTDGVVGSAGASAICAPLRCSQRGSAGSGRSLEHKEQSAWEAALPGMSVEQALTEGGVTLALGHKSPGTEVPMLARVRRAGPGAAGPAPRPGDAPFATGGPTPEVVWQTNVPAVDPLTVRGGAPDPDKVSVAEQVVAVTYEMKDSSAGSRITVFSLADGRRRFDRALPEGARNVWSILFGRNLVIVTSTWGVLAAYDLESGEEQYVVD